MGDATETVVTNPSHQYNSPDSFNVSLVVYSTDGCIDTLTPVLCKLFNHLFANGLYPEQWTRGVIIPVPKKGDLNDVNNSPRRRLVSAVKLDNNHSFKYRLCPQ